MKYLRKFNEKRVPKDERDLILKDNKYVIVAPLTHSASCKYGADAAWCTANLDYDYIWDEYKSNTPNKNDTFLIYIIQRNYEVIDEAKNRRLTELRRLHEEGALSDDYPEDEDLGTLELDPDAYDYSNIPISYYNGRFEAYDKQNNEIVFIKYLHQLPIDQYAIDKISDYIKTKQQS